MDNLQTHHAHQPALASAQRVSELLHIAVYKLIMQSPAEVDAFDEFGACFERGEVSQACTLHANVKLADPGGPAHGLRPA